MKVFFVSLAALFLFGCSTPEIYNNSYQPDADQMEKHDNRSLQREKY